MVDLTLQKWLPLILGLMLCHYISCDCLLPEHDFPYGTVSSPDSYDEENQTFVPELSLIHFKCFDGYKLIGPEFLQCLEGNWSREAPFCSETKCPNPPLTENAKRVIDSGANTELAIGSLAVYSCKDGQELVNANASTLRCNVSGASRKTEWEGEMPACKDKTECADPGKSADGERSGDCCLSGDTLSFTCHEGYELVGNRTIRCLRNGVWSSGRPRCRPPTNYCDFPPPIPHGVLTGRKKGDYFAAEEEAEVSCEPGYKCEGNRFVVCEEDGKWEDDFGVCKEIFCSPPAPLANGTIPELKTSNLTVFPYDFEITYVCDAGYRIYSGDSWRTCGKRGWSGKTPRCQVIRCPDPGTPDNGIKIGTDYTVGSSVRFSCFEGYELLGSMEMLCSTNGQWVGEVARCNTPSNYCPDPGAPINGFKNMTEYRKGDRVRFRCQTGHALLGAEVRECLPDRTWSGTTTKCLGRYDYDNSMQVRDALTAMLADIKELQKIQEGVLFPSQMIILYFAFDVSGTITLSNFEKGIGFAKAIVRKVGISQHGVRAGAVAFGSKDEGLFSPLSYSSTEDVLAALSRVNYTGLKILKDTDSLQTFDVRKIHDHDRYRHDVSMDNDIALLEVEKPIVYNAYVRPICLPPKVVPEKSKLYKPKAITWAIGWGHTRVMHKLSSIKPIVSQNLKEIAFPIQSEETCRESLRDEPRLYNFTSRMFCAGSGEGNNDTCKGDSGGPVMQSQVNGEGYVEWTQVGLVSWGLGCGLRNEYGFYTHLHELLPWIDNTIQGALKWMQK